MSKENNINYPDEYKQIRETILKNLKQQNLHEAYSNIREILD